MIVHFPSLSVLHKKRYGQKNVNVHLMKELKRSQVVWQALKWMIMEALKWWMKQLEIAHTQKAHTQKSHTQKSHTQELKGKSPFALAVKNMHQVDGKSRWFSLSIASIGTIQAVSVGGWAMSRRPLGNHQGANPWVLGAAITLVGTGFCQLLHGVMRFEERTTSAFIAQKLLKNPKRMKYYSKLYLQARARAAKSTRFWGGVITTMQGLSTGLLGAKLLLDDQDSWNTQGYIFLTAGVLITGVGIIHFFGNPRAERELDTAIRKSKTQQAQFGFSPTLVYDGFRSHAGIAMRGSF